MGRRFLIIADFNPRNYYEKNSHPFYNLLNVFVAFVF